MEFQLEGRNAVKEAIRKGRAIDRIYVLDEGDRRLSDIVGLAYKNKLVVIKCNRKKLDTMSKTDNHQGVIALCAATDYVSVEDILKEAENRNEPPFIVIADGITDPHNLGALIRTACAAGVHGVIIPKRRSVGVNETVEKVASGAVENIMIAKVSNLTDTIKLLKSKGVWVAGTDVSGQKTIYQQDLTGSLAVIVGSEGEGMTNLVKENCDFLVTIPMSGKIQSLNASVAAGVVLYEVVRQRGEKND